MPCLWLQHNRSQLFLDVGIVDAVALAKQQTQAATGVIPIPPLFRALVDTGAQRTMISPNVIKTVGLSPIGKVKLQGIGKRVTYHNGYLFHAAFVVGLQQQQGQPQAQPTQQQVMVFVNALTIHGAELSSAVGFDVLLGMDVISTGSLHIEGNGTFSFSF